MTESGDFVVVDDGPEPITDIKVLSKKENKHQDFELVRGGVTWACLLGKCRANDRIHKRRNKLLTGLVSVGGRGGTEEALARMIMALYSPLLLLS